MFQPYKSLLPAASLHHSLVLLCWQSWWRTYTNNRHTVDFLQSLPLRFRSWTVLAEDTHHSTDTPSTANTQLRTLCLFRGQSWWRTYNQKVCHSPEKRFKNRHAVDRSTSPSHFVLVSLAVLAEELHRKRGGSHYCAPPLFRVVPSFKLHRSRWLRCQIVEHPIHVIHLIYYSIHHLLQD